VFLLTAALGLPALAAIAFVGEPPDRSVGAANRPRRAARPGTLAARGAGCRPDRAIWRLLLDHRLLIFCLCAAAFHLANAAMLPLAAGRVTQHIGGAAPLIIAASIVLPQLVAALSSPVAARWAQSWGRRPILLLGFATLPLRGALFAMLPASELVIPVQVLDGIGAVAFGVLAPLIVADITRRVGHFTLCLGIVGFSVGAGATLSTTLAGLAADYFGATAAFAILAGAGLAATLFVWALMPETKPPAAAIDEES
jgi:MFS family permease